jgi:hypothetical protein
MGNQATESPTQVQVSDLLAKKADLLKQLEEIQAAEQDAHGNAVSILQDEAAGLTNPAISGLTPTDEQPVAYALIFSGEGKVRVTELDVKALRGGSATKDRKIREGKTKASDFGLQAKDLIFRTVATAKLAETSGFDIGAEIPLQVVSDTEFAAQDSAGNWKKGSLTGCFKHAFGYPHEVNGVEAWLRHDSSYVKRGETVLQLDKGHVVSA